MRDNSGQGKSHNNDHDPTLKEHLGEGGPGARDQAIDNSAGFEVAADLEQPGGQPSPGKRGPGEVSADQVSPSGD